MTSESLLTVDDIKFIRLALQEQELTAMPRAPRYRLNIRIQFACDPLLEQPTEGGVGKSGPS